MAMKTEHIPQADKYRNNQMQAEKQVQTGISLIYDHFKNEIEERLRRIYDGFMSLKKEGHAVDAIAPEAAIYLTIKIDLTGKKTAEGKILNTQSDVTSYILNTAGLAVVPFYAFGADRSSPWYRLSAGTCKKEEIDEMISKLKEALRKLS